MKRNEWTARPRWASDEVIAAARDQYVRGVIELAEFEATVERGLIDDETILEGRPQEDEWLRQAVEAHRKAHAVEVGD